MERGFKDVFMNLICVFFCLIGFLITLGMVTKSMVIATAVLAILVGLFHFMWKSEVNCDHETALLYLGLISILFGIILFVTGILDNDKANYILMILFFLYGGATTAIVNCVKGGIGYKEGESGLRLATNFVFGFATIVQILPVSLVLGGLCSLGLSDYFFSSHATYVIALLVTSIVPLVAFILMIIDYIANRGVSTSYSSNRSYNKRHNYSDESRDYRDKATGPFYNILSDKCRSIASEFSSSHELSHGRAQFSVSVRINRNSIAYTIDVISTMVNATSQYDMNELQRTLKYELENVADMIYGKTETVINKLRDKYQDFDGEYSINVKVGSVR